MEQTNYLQWVEANLIREAYLLQKLLAERDFRTLKKYITNFDLETLMQLPERYYEGIWFISPQLADYLKSKGKLVWTDGKEFYWVRDNRFDIKNIYDNMMLTMD